jgi:hypothetical protein
MILLVTPNLRAKECAGALSEATGEEVILAEHLRRAAALLRTESYTAVVLDQYLLETEPDETETVMRHLGTAIPLQVNLAISGMDRLVREVRSGVQRRRREEAAAREAATRTLHSELNGTITALLLSCEMALSTPGMPLAAVEKLESAHQLVRDLRSQLSLEK